MTVGRGWVRTRMRLLLGSLKKTLPKLSTASPEGVPTIALAAGPPSPENPCMPLPAIVVMIPFDTSRTRKRLLSAI
jgi:hypothetical protein